MGPLGFPEMMIILVVALIVFGPRKLPELGRSLGKSLNEFKRASNELRNTLDDEIRAEEQKEADGDVADRSRLPCRPRPRRRPSRAATSGRAPNTNSPISGRARSGASCLSHPWRPTPSSVTSPTTSRRTTEESTDERSRMSFLEHLDELRRRILYSLYALVACGAVSFWYWEPLYAYFIRYFRAFGGELIFTQADGRLHVQLEAVGAGGAARGVAVHLLAAVVVRRPGLVREGEEGRAAVRGRLDACSSAAAPGSRTASRFRRCGGSSPAMASRA